MQKGLIPHLGQGLQKYDTSDNEAQDSKNTIKIFESEIWPRIEKYVSSKS